MKLRKVKSSAGSDRSNKPKRQKLEQPRSSAMMKMRLGLEAHEARTKKQRTEKRQEFHILALLVQQSGYCKVPPKLASPRQPFYLFARCPLS